MSNLKETLSKNLTSADVERKGQNAYKAGKVLMLIGLCGLVLMLAICLVSQILGARFVDPLLFSLYDNYALVYPLIALAYLAMLCGVYGIASYNVGIYLFAFGRIAVNTEKEDAKVVIEDELPEL